MREILGKKDLVDSVVIYGPPRQSTIMGFSKCSTTDKYIYKDEVITLCENPECDSCIQYEKLLKTFTGTGASEHK
jgi:hypothetical protein